jgi:hypothetical protein
LSRGLACLGRYFAPPRGLTGDVRAPSLTTNRTLGEPLSFPHPPHLSRRRLADFR